MLSICGRVKAPSRQRTVTPAGTSSVGKSSGFGAAPGRAQLVSMLSGDGPAGAQPAQPSTTATSAIARRPMPKHMGGDSAKMNPLCLAGEGGGWGAPYFSSSIELMTLLASPYWIASVADIQ